MNAKMFRYAEIINQACNVESSYDSSKSYDLIIAYDNDLSTTLEACKIYFQLRKQNPRIKLVLATPKDALCQIALRLTYLSLFVRRPFSSNIRKRYTYPLNDTVGKRLSRIASETGLAPQNMQIIEDNDFHALKHLVDGKSALIVVPQRLALLLKQNVSENVALFVVQATIEDLRHWHNFMRAGNDRMILLVFSKIARQISALDHQFSDKESQALQALKNAKTWHYYPFIFFSIFFNAKNCIRSEKKAIKDFNLYSFTKKTFT